jgi:hypothetical protein
MTLCSSSHRYLFDVIPLLNDCLEKLQLTIDRDTSTQHYALYDMKEVLCCTERLLHQYMDRRIRQENQGLIRPIPHDSNCNMQQALRTFRLVLVEKQLQNESNRRKIQFLNPQDPLPSDDSSIKRYSSRSATDSLLFRLIVALQQCLSRIDDAHLVITGRRMSWEDEDRWNHEKKLAWACCCCILGAGFVYSSFSNRLRIDRTRWKEILPTDPRIWAKGLASGGAAILGGRMIKFQWEKLWMTDTIYKSTCEIDEWTRQWQAIQNDQLPRGQRERVPERPCAELLEDKSRRLIEYAMKNSPKTYFWQSKGEIRFLMLKRFMDVYYASIGTAIDSSGSDTDFTWKVPLIAGAAASFYSITGTGASIKASHVVNQRSRDLIQHAW